jgi:hypothetical protein
MLAIAVFCRFDLGMVVAVVLAVVCDLLFVCLCGCHLHERVCRVCVPGCVCV